MVIDKNGKFLGEVDDFKDNTHLLGIKHGSTINYKATTMQALELLLKEGREEVAVVDDSNKYLGNFSIKSAYGKTFLSQDIKTKNVSSNLEAQT